MVTGAMEVARLEKPLPSEIDVFGVTHQGLVRPTNADHFLVAAFHRAMKVHATSLAGDPLHLSTYSRGYIFLVADGVGSMPRGAAGSEQAVNSISGSLLDMTEIALQSEPQREGEMIEQIKRAVANAHEAILELGKTGGRREEAATTLTMAIAVWPRLFVIHAGDSRCYRYRLGELHRLTTDQTMAQAMVESGIMTPDAAERSNYRNVLLSALGSSQFDPEISVSDLDRADATLLCSDGLTRHVKDDEIRARMAMGGSSESICRDLVDLALNRGGEDNVTVVVGKIRS
jgi:serine/threonine protein phosphatase PrpC